MIRNRQDFLAGLMFLGLGAAIAIGSLSYNMGTSGRVGPGFFPFALGIIIAILGVILCFQSTRGSARKSELPPLNPSATVAVLGGIMLFASTLAYLGLVAATVLLVAISSFATGGFRWKFVLPTAAVLAIGATLLFVEALSLPIPVYPTFLR